MSFHSEHVSFLRKELLTTVTGTQPRAHVAMPLRSTRVVASRGASAQHRTSSPEGRPPAGELKTSDLDGFPLISIHFPWISHGFPMDFTGFPFISGAWPVALSCKKASKMALYASKGLEAPPERSLRTWLSAARRSGKLVALRALTAFTPCSRPDDTPQR